MSGAGFIGSSRPGDGRPARAPEPPPIFLDFFYKLRERGLKVAPQEWFVFLEGLEKGLAGASAVGLYYLGRATLVKSEGRYDSYDVAFAEFFRNLQPPPGVSEAIEKWLADAAAGLDGPALASLLEQLPPLDLDELLKRFEEKLKTQDERHDGGKEFIGTGGLSPFGQLGKNPAGVRVGGQGGGRSAVKIAEQRQFRDYRSDRTLDVRLLRVALRRLRDLVREGAADELSLDETIEKTGKNAGDIDLVWKRPRKNRVRLLLCMDAGGSMEPYAQLVDRLFSAASQEKNWKSFDHYYFHNCVYTHIYRDGAFLRRVPTEQVIRDCDAEWKLVMVGDACMAMSELLARGGSIDYGTARRQDAAGIEWLRRLATHFRKAVWLNPMTKPAWDHPSVRAIGVLFPMYELTIDGIERAVKALKASG